MLKTHLIGAAALALAPCLPALAFAQEKAPAQGAKPFEELAAQLVAAETEGLWRSEDNADTWHKLSYDQEDVGALAVAPDGTVYVEGEDGHVFRLKN